MIRVHIERLILDGLELGAGDAPLVRAAVESELRRIVAERGLGAEVRGGGALASVRGGDVQLKQGDGPAKVGRQVASAIHEGIGR